MKCRWFEFAKKEIGIKEFPGPRNNPSVQRYFADAIGQKMADSVPWCAAFVGSCLARGQVKGTGSLMARSYLNWGKVLKEPKEGCVVVLSRGRPPSGHVGFYAGSHRGFVLVLGGNQSDEVNIKPYPKARVLGYRWPRDGA